MLLGGLLEEKSSGGDMEGNLDMGFIPRDQHWRTLQLLQPTHNVGSEFLLVKGKWKHNEDIRLFPKGEMSTLKLVKILILKRKT